MVNEVVAVRHDGIGVIEVMEDPVSGLVHESFARCARSSPVMPAGPVWAYPCNANFTPTLNTYQPSESRAARSIDIVIGFGH